MADIQTLLTKMLSAVYGKDVRQSIHDAIKQCYYDNTQYIQVTPKEPVQKETKIWINPNDVVEEFNLPEIEDYKTSKFDTWSSSKIASSLDFYRGDCGNLTKKFDKFTTFKKIVCDNTGTFVASNYINTYGFVAESDFYIWNEKEIADGESYLSIALFRYGVQSPDNLIGIYRHKDNEDTLPTVDNKLFVSKGSYVAISSVLGTFDFNTTYPVLGYKANDKMLLSDNQLKQIGHELNVDILFDRNENYVEMTNTFDEFVYVPQSNIHTNGFEGNTTTDVYYFIAADDFKVYVKDLASNYFSLTICTGTVDNPIFKQRWRRYLSSGEDTLPREDAPIDIAKGEMFCVIVDAGKGFSLQTTYTKCGLYLSDKVKMRTTGLTIHYTTSEDGDIMTIYKKTGCGQYYLGLSFSRIPMSDINSDVWRISGMRLYDTSFTATSHEQIVLGGEWECAIKEKGASDFMGGTLHGDETQTFSQGFLDSKPLDLSNGFKMEGDKFEFISVSTLNRVDTPNQVVCDHIKKYTITTDCIEIDQAFHFTKPMALDPSYIAMLPINRTYTTNAYRFGTDYTGAVEDISQDEHGQVHSLGNKQKVFMYGDNLTATVDIDCDSEHNGSLFISDSVNPSYNKVYFSFVGYNGDNVLSGETVRVNTKYTIDMNMK